MISTAAPKVMWVGRARTLAFWLLALLVAVSIGVLLAANPAHADTFNVNSTEDAFDNDSTDGECDTTRFPQPGTEPNCTLRAAIEEANANGETDTISFVSGLSGTITLTLGGLEIENDTPATDLDIQGPGARKITVSGNGTSVVFVTHQLTNATISGLTISGGFSPSTGGGITNLGTLALANSAVSDNSAFNSFGTGGYGGGIYNGVNGTLTLANSVVSGNVANSGTLGAAASSTPARWGCLARL